MKNAQHDHNTEMPAWRDAVRLTADERALLRLTAQGYAPEQAAGAVGVTVRQARDTLEGLQARCGAQCRRALLVRASLEGWLEH